MDFLLNIILIVISNPSIVNPGQPEKESKVFVSYIMCRVLSLLMT